MKNSSVSSTQSDKTANKLKRRLSGLLLLYNASMIQRLDKFLSDAAVGTRKEIKGLIVKKKVTVDGTVVRDPSMKFDFDEVKVELNGRQIRRVGYILCVMNKPAGYVTSTDDPLSPTVMELVPSDYLDMGVVPVGRLDKDTEGVLLFSNDGTLIHRLISPKSEIEKVYYAEFEGVCPDDIVQRFEEGVELKDGSICKSAVFEKLSESSCRITIREGMYHQVKRMMASCSLHVTYLRRERFDNITCKDLPLGGFKKVEDYYGNQDSVYR